MIALSACGAFTDLLVVSFLDTRSVMYERTFLQDIADQNFTKYQVDRRGTSLPKVADFLCTQKYYLNLTLHLAVKSYFHHLYFSISFLRRLLVL